MGFCVSTKKIVKIEEKSKPAEVKSNLLYFPQGKSILTSKNDILEM